MFVIRNSTVFYLHADKEYALMYDEHNNVVKVKKHRPSPEFSFSFKPYHRNNQCIL